MVFLYLIPSHTRLVKNIFEIDMRDGYTIRLVKQIESGLFKNEFITVILIRNFQKCKTCKNCNNCQIIKIVPNYETVKMVH
jgi:predicted transcriptional regulator